MTRDRSTEPARWIVRSWQWTFRLVLAFGTLLAISYGASRFLSRPPYAPIIDELPISARLVRHERIRHGVDYCHLFEFSCSDAALRERLVSRWQLRDLARSNEKAPTSFAENDHPDWWMPDTPATTRRFGRSDDDSESYVSVWEQSETRRLYVEVGRW